MAVSFIVEWNVQMAGSLLAARPTLVVYILLGRYFMRGLLAGSLKGKHSASPRRCYLCSHRTGSDAT